MFSSFSDLLDQWPAGELAKSLGVPPERVRKWRERNSIPSEAWAALIEDAERRAFKGISLKLLAQLAAQRKAA